MSTTVRIPTQLRALTEGRDEVQATGVTVAELIRDLEARHPSIAARLLDDGGNVRRFVNLYLNEEDIRFLDGLTTTVPDDACLSIIPAVAGG
ncbi:MAG: MoaD/ThiS family protein [Actinomycetota bacterium]